MPPTCQSCFLTHLFQMIFCLFPLHPLLFCTLSQAWSSPGAQSHLRRWWQGLCSGTTGRQPTAAPWRDTMWECTSPHTGWVRGTEKKNKEPLFFKHVSGLNSYQNTEKHGRARAPSAEQEGTADSRDWWESAAGWRRLLCVCVFKLAVVGSFSPFILSPPPLFPPHWHHLYCLFGWWTRW